MIQPLAEVPPVVTSAERRRARLITNRQAVGECSYCYQRGAVVRLTAESPWSHGVTVTAICPECARRALDLCDAYPPTVAVPQTTAPAAATAGA